MLWEALLFVEELRYGKSHETMSHVPLNSKSSSREELEGYCE